MGRTQEFEGQFTINFDDLSQLAGTNQFAVKLNTLIVANDFQERVEFTAQEP